MHLQVTDVSFLLCNVHAIIKVSHKADRKPVTVTLAEERRSMPAWGLALSSTGRLQRWNEKVDVSCQALFFFCLSGCFFWQGETLEEKWTHGPSFRVVIVSGRSPVKWMAEDKERERVEETQMSENNKMHPVVQHSVFQCIKEAVAPLSVFASH